MKVAIMQPYFFPYIGYFQLIAAVDLFIVYDDIQYTKKGWINRNRILQGGKDVTFTLPLKGASDHLDVRERELAGDFNRDKLLNQLRGAYRRAPHFSRTFPLVEQILRHEDTNLFGFLHHSLVKTCQHLGVSTPLEISSEVADARALKGQDKVLALCAAVRASAYVNAIGGMELYSREVFRDRSIDLSFIQSKPFEYAQLGDAFVPWLSIIDVMMFNSLETIHTTILKNYELV